MNFPKRVPVLANPQDGSSMRKPSSASNTFSLIPAFILRPHFSFIVPRLTGLWRHSTTRVTRTRTGVSLALERGNGRMIEGYHKRFPDEFLQSLALSAPTFHQI